MAATPLTTDLYLLTMMAGYFEQGRHERTTASFEAFVRKLPQQRNYLVAAGLASLVAYLEQLLFSPDEIEWLRSHPMLSRLPAAFFEYLRQFRFTGDVDAVPEGTPVFAQEPIVRVTAPIAQAQLIETAVLSFVNFQTSIASKTSRIVTAAAGRPVMEFGARRAHGLEAALFAARSAYLAGASSTSFVEAGREFGIPLSGTMAHSWVMSAVSESQAFADYMRVFGPESVLLLDTYDTLAAARLVVESGLVPAGVRLDSGGLATLSFQVREILDRGGLSRTKILVSGDLDEFSIAGLLADGAPIDGFGVGTRLVTSEDAPALGGVYKLVEIVEGGSRRFVAKRSTGKPTWPGCKQVWREMRDGRAVRDIVSLATEHRPEAVPLLHGIMRNGQRVEGAISSLEASRQWCATRLAELPVSTLNIGTTADYPVDISAALSTEIESATAP
jgi:nicotinate phosphoribosyltransferase